MRASTISDLLRAVGFIVFWYGFFALHKELGIVPWQVYVMSAGYIIVGMALAMHQSATRRRRP